jgi:hypothetical protein
MNKRIRQTHRWLGLIFTLSTACTFIALFTNSPSTVWLFYVPFPALIALMILGVYLFFQPYVAKRRSARAPS